MVQSEFFLGVLKRLSKTSFCSIVIYTVNINVLPITGDNSSCKPINLISLKLQRSSRKELSRSYARFFYKQYFYKQSQTDIGTENQVHAKQHPEADLSLFENYSHSLLTLSSKNDRTYCKK